MPQRGTGERELGGPGHRAKIHRGTGCAGSSNKKTGVGLTFHTMFLVHVFAQRPAVCLHEADLDTHEAKLQKNSRLYLQWTSHSAQVRAKLGISRDYDGWTRPGSLPGVVCRGVPRQPRMFDILNCAWAARLKSLGPGCGTDEARRNFFANPSQSVNRTPWSEGAKTLCSSSFVYSFELDSLLSGMDMMRLQGWSSAKLHRFSDGTLRDLAGEGFSLPCAGAVLYAFFLNPHAPWWGGQDAACPL
jgi:hypothetical protein